MIRIAFILLVGALAMGMMGCGSNESAPSSDPKSTTKAPMANTPGQDPHAPPPTDGKEVDLAKLETSRAAAETAFKKAGSDEAAKKAFVDATVKLATETMMSPDLAPREKYGKALKLYREALKIDPKNQEALENSKMIEDIYKSMGRPVPQA